MSKILRIQYLLEESPIIFKPEAQIRSPPTLPLPLGKNTQNMQAFMGIQFYYVCTLLFHVYLYFDQCLMFSSFSTLQMFSFSFSSLYLLQLFYVIYLSLYAVLKYLHCIRISVLFKVYHFICILLFMLLLFLHLCVITYILYSAICISLLFMCTLNFLFMLLLCLYMYLCMFFYLHIHAILINLLSFFTFYVYIVFLYICICTR